MTFSEAFGTCQCISVLIWQQVTDLIILRFTYRFVHGVLQKHRDFLALGHLGRCVNL